MSDFFIWLGTTLIAASVVVGALPKKTLLTGSYLLGVVALGLLGYGCVALGIYMTVY